VYATILYYLHYRETVSQYLAEWIEHGEKMRTEQRRNPSPVAVRLQKFKADRDALRSGNPRTVSHG
jgi:hypothetical protein